jgi:hypothetical protein
MANAFLGNLGSPDFRNFLSEHGFMVYLQSQIIISNLWMCKSSGQQSNVLELNANGFFEFYKSL